MPSLPWFIKGQHFALFFFLFASRAISQEVERKNNLKVDIIQPCYYLAVNSFGYSLSYERLIRGRNGLQIGVEGAADKNYEGHYETIKIVPSYRCYIFKKTKGYYFGAYGKYINYHAHINDMDKYDASDDSYEFIQHKVALGILNGYLFYLGAPKRFFIDPTLGLGVSQVLKTVFIKNGSYSFQKTRLDGLIALNVGLSF